MSYSDVGLGRSKDRRRKSRPNFNGQPGKTRPPITPYPNPPKGESNIRIDCWRGNLRDYEKRFPEAIFVKIVEAMLYPGTLKQTGKSREEFVQKYEEFLKSPKAQSLLQKLKELSKLKVIFLVEESHYPHEGVRAIIKKQLDQIK